ncbi:DUF3885 domain-containing protein [Paenibacillus psychroresistens]|uniref:DUF3885 domain-containing protein n=1 Tax=Paenibacillus psychroresistens TaxID=1778678 RepID=A0A6B8RAT1_9BACL|nr:DUF3885 domain-containing protein [Paenibacillus psychroresistens]QGQ93781.1 DUF3885 domain-containing protein [Paenibacillus psychroresistens]
MIQEINEYLQEKFPNFWSDTNIRFELGEPYRNGSKQRLLQVNRRVSMIFEELFKPEDYIYVYIKDWAGYEDPMFGNTTPNYLYDLLEGKSLETGIGIDLDEDEDENGISIEVKNEYQIKILFGLVSSFPSKKIFEGISHYEQGKEPAIGQKIYFINKEKNILFHMYDDRGCIAHTLSKEDIRPLYDKYNDWLVDYWRAYINNIFKE